MDQIRISIVYIMEGGRVMTKKLSTQECIKMYERYKNLLYRIAYTYVKNNEDVEDLLQEVFIKRMYKAPEFESQEHEKRWMIRVTVNLAKNHVKSFWHRNRTTMEEILETPDIVQWKLNEEEKEVFSEVMSLPEKQRISIYLHYFEGYTCKEIAEILKSKESTIKNRLKKGREILRERLS